MDEMQTERNTSGIKDVMEGVHSKHSFHQLGWDMGNSLFPLLTPALSPSLPPSHWRELLSAGETAGGRVQFSDRL
jgi:hypothetical protein